LVIMQGKKSWMGALVWLRTTQVAVNHANF
jgi:hypothetical protein